MNSYKINYKCLNSLNEINETKNVCLHYEHNDIQFAFRHVENSGKLVISFHGETKTDFQLPIFRFPFIRNSSPVSHLSICDDLLIKYKNDELTLSWYLDTIKYSNHKKYHELINFIINTYAINDKVNDKVIFFGTSGGGFPALKYSSIFNKSCLISNFQVYLDKHGRFKNLCKILEKNNDELVYEKLEDIFQKYGNPECIHLYTNSRDKPSYVNQTLPFINYLESINANVKINIFIGDPTVENQHRNQFDTCYKKLLLEM